MKGDKLVSVIIPTFNNEEHIEECIKSILDQTYKNFEILIYNDGSTDHTREILKEWVKHNRISVFNSYKNKGPSTARNFLLEHAQGDYIMLQDADDRSMPERMEKCFKFLEESDFVLVGCNMLTSGGHVLYHDIKDEYMIAIYNFRGAKSLGGPSCFFHRDVIDVDVRYNEDLKVGEDVLFNIEIQGQFPLCIRALPDKQPYYWYRKREGSLTHIRKKDQDSLISKKLIREKNLKIRQIMSKVMLDYKDEIMKYIKDHPSMYITELKEFYEQNSETYSGI